jgi:uncharacterized membrane protein (TIGR02234 family)
MNLKRRTAVLWAIAAGAIILGTGAQTWVEATEISGLPGTVVTATGNQSAAVVPAMALVGMAAGIALSMARRIGRWVTSILIVLAGTATAWASVQAALDPASAAHAQVSQTSGTTADAGAYAVTVWPWLTLAAGVLLALCGIAVLLFGRGWTANRRYDTATTGAAATGASSATSPSPRESAAPDRSVDPATTDQPDRTADEPEDEPGHLDEIDAWDDLSRGKDPT